MRLPKNSAHYKILYQNTVKKKLLTNMLVLSKKVAIATNGEGYNLQS